MINKGKKKIFGLNYLDKDYCLSIGLKGVPPREPTTHDTTDTFIPEYDHIRDA